MFKCVVMSGAVRGARHLLADCLWRKAGYCLKWAQSRQTESGD